MSDYKLAFNIKPYDEKKQVFREYKYYVNDAGIHKDIGEDCKGHFFDTLQEAHKYWIDNNTAPEA
jgi:hypothetical protein